MAALRNKNRLLSPFQSPTTSDFVCLFCRRSRAQGRRLAAISRPYSHESNSERGPFRYRLRAALQKTKLDWRPIPVTLGIGFLGLVQFYRVQRRERARKEEEEEEEAELESHKPAKRKRIRPSGPWYGKLSWKFLYSLILTE